MNALRLLAKVLLLSLAAATVMIVLSLAECLTTMNCYGKSLNVPTPPKLDPAALRGCRMDLAGNVWLLYVQVITPDSKWERLLLPTHKTLPKAVVACADWLKEYDHTIWVYFGSTVSVQALRGKSP